jgi:hypothetical protein
MPDAQEHPPVPCQNSFYSRLSASSCSLGYSAVFTYQAAEDLRTIRAAISTARRAGLHNRVMVLTCDVVAGLVAVMLWP